MKKAIVSILSGLIAVSAGASTLDCTDYVTPNPLHGSHNFSIEDLGNNQVQITETRSGGIAQFITAPVTITADVVHVGPEVVIYENQDNGFKLTVVFQPIAGQIHGTLETSNLIFPENNVPVVCSVSSS